VAHRIGRPIAGAGPAARTGVTRVRRWIAAGALAVTMTVALGGCFDVQSPDLFLITRTGSGSKLTILINDSGTISCNGGKAKPISNSRLIQARDLADNLGTDATAKLTIPPAAGDVYYYRIKLQAGSIAFPDKAADARHPNLAQAELFTVQAATQACGIAG
jgi:hypothetical protein